MNLVRLAHVRDRLAAARVLQHRGMVDLRRPDEAVRAFLAMRRHGAFGGLLSHTAARYGDAPAITTNAARSASGSSTRIPTRWPVRRRTREFAPARWSHRCTATAGT